MQTARRVLTQYWLRGLGVAIVLGLLLVTIASPRLIPYNMDEFIAYQTVGCVVRPDGADVIEEVATESCRKDNLRFPKTTTWLPLRTYNYIGSISGLFYAPFHLLFNSPFSVRFQGLVFFLITAFLMAKFLRVKLTYVLLAALIFAPFVFSFIVDTGPIGLSAILLLIILLLIRTGFERKPQRTRDLYMLSAGALAFVGFWIKPSFGWWLPVVALYITYRAYRKRSKLLVNVRTTIRQGLPFLVSFVPLTALLLLTVDRKGYFYAEYLSMLNLRVESVREAVINTKKLFPLIFQGNHISSVAVDVTSRLRDLFPGVLFVGIVWWWSRNKKLLKDRRPVYLFISAVIVFVFAIVSFGIATHHAPLVVVFLVMLVALLLNKLPDRAVIGIAILTGLFWLNLLMRVNNAPVYQGTTRSKDELLAQVQADNQNPKTAFINVTWGTYFMNNLYAAPQQEVWYYNLDDKPIEELMKRLQTLPSQGINEVVILVADPNKARVRERFNQDLSMPSKSYNSGNWAAYIYKLPEPTTY